MTDKKLILLTSYIGTIIGLVCFVVIGWLWKAGKLPFQKQQATNPEIVKIQPAPLPAPVPLPAPQIHKKTGLRIMPGTLKTIWKNKLVSEITGTVENNHPYKVGLVKLTFDIRYKSGKVINKSHFLNDLEPGDQCPFTITVVNDVHDFLSPICTLTEIKEGW